MSKVPCLFLVMDTDKKGFSSAWSAFSPPRRRKIRANLALGNLVSLIRVEPIISPSLRIHPGMLTFPGAMAAKLKRDCIHLPEQFWRRLLAVLQTQPLLHLSQAFGQRTKMVFSVVPRVLTSLRYRQSGSTRPPQPVTKIMPALSMRGWMLNFSANISLDPVMASS